MRWLRRLASGLALAALVGLAGCSGLRLAYNQLPLLAGFWADRYLDLDRDQQRLFGTQFQAWQDWHRREELPRWVALLEQAKAALDGGVSRDELLALEQGARASAERCLQRAAPLAAPLLASLRPAQWQHLQLRLAQRLDDWREEQTGRDALDVRAEQYSDQLSRWLGPLERPTRRQARADAQAWQVDVPALAQARSVRHAQTVEALRAWARGNLAGGTALLMNNTLPQLIEQPYREQVLASLLKLLNGMTPAERERVRAHWADWVADLRRLQDA